MADGRINNGGKREGAGRKPKGEEQVLIEKLTLYEDKAHEVLKEALMEGKPWAVRMYFNYRYGKPVETQRVFNIEEVPLFPDVPADHSSQ